MSHYYAVAPPYWPAEDAAPPAPPLERLVSPYDPPPFAYVRDTAERARRTIVHRTNLLAADALSLAHALGCAAEHPGVGGTHPRREYASLDARGHVVPPSMWPTDTATPAGLQDARFFDAAAHVLYCNPRSRLGRTLNALYEAFDEMGLGEARARVHPRLHGERIETVLALGHALYEVRHDPDHATDREDMDAQTLLDAVNGVADAAPPGPSRRLQPYE